MRKKNLKKALALGLVLASTSLLSGNTSFAADTYGTVDVDGYDYANDIAKTATPYSGVMYDGGWYAPDGKFYTYVNANGVVTDTLIACDVVGGKAVLTTAQENKLVSMGLDHNEQADSVADNKRVPSYLDIMGGNNFNAANVAKALADNLKFNSDLVRTVCQWEEADRKATDKYLNGKIDTIGVVQNTDHSFTFTNGSGTPTTISFTDTDTNTTVSSVTTGINSSGVITTTVKSSDGKSKSDTVDISSFVNNSITNNAQNATVTVNGTKTTITKAINQNTTNITNNSNKITNLQKDVTNIENTYVSDITENVINNDYKTWTITQGGKKTVITDKYITGFDKSSVSVGEDGTFTTTITRNDGSSFSQTVDMSEYVGDKIKNEAANANITINNEQTTIQNAVTNNYNEIQNINDNNVTNITKNNNNSWTVTQTIDGIENEVTITDTITTASLGQSSNLMLQEKIDQQNNTIHYTIDLKDDVTFNSVSADTINATTANLGTVNAGNINATTATIGTVNAGDVNANTFNGNIGNFNTVNGGTANFNTVNAGAVNSNTVGTGTIYLGTSQEYTTITYENGSDRITYDDNVIATLDDGMKYGADEGDDISLKLNGKLTVAGDKNITTKSDGDGTINITLNDDITVDTVNSTTVNSTTVNTTTVNVGDNITIEEGNVDMGGNKITNVYEGDLYQGSMDAVNGGQLWQTNQRLDSLGNRVDKVGAGAAALAALHPLDFDPDDKLSFSAGVGNYAGATASAIGAFYRPDERTMFSIGGTIGNGENMVNAGVSFALGKGGKVTTSRVAMAHEINDLRAQVAELTAMVSQLTALHSNFKFDSMRPFPDTPENHWAYEYVAKLAAEGIVEGYPSGNFDGERTMTRYEYAAMLYRALEKGFAIDERVIDEFEPELGRLSVERIKGELNQKDKIERVRVNNKEADRDVYGTKINVGKVW